MSGKGSVRVWSQQTGIVDGVGVLQLSHPDGRSATHYFDAVLLDVVERYYWRGVKGYAQTYDSSTGKHTRLHWLHFGDRGINEVDHLNHDTFDSRRENLELKSKRSNQHNRKRQSEYGDNIYATRYSFVVHVVFNKRPLFQPGFKTLEQATVCRDRFLEIAHSFDTGERPIPTKDELRAIASSICT